VSAKQRLTFGLALLLAALSGLLLVVAFFAFGIQTDGGSDVLSGSGCARGLWDLLGFVAAACGAGSSSLAVIGARSKRGTTERRLMILGFIGPFVGLGLWLAYASLAC